jgi:hypothetical protein
MAAERALQQRVQQLGSELAVSQVCMHLIPTAADNTNWATTLCQIPLAACTQHTQQQGRQLGLTSCCSQPHASC